MVPDLLQNLNEPLDVGVGAVLRLFSLAERPGPRDEQEEGDGQSENCDRAALKSCVWPLRICPSA